MFGINKNGTKEKIGILLPASYPSNKVTYGAGTVKDALDDTVSKANGGTFEGNVSVNRANGTISADGTSDFYVGNNIPSGTVGNSRGRLNLYGKQSYRTILRAYDSTADRTISFPDASGTVALTSDVDKKLNGSGVSIPANGSTTVTLNSGYKYLLFTFAAAASLKSAYLINCSSSDISWIPLMDSSYGTRITLSSNALTLTIASSSSSNTNGYLVRIFDGS